jgi:hypothetical protein
MKKIVSFILIISFSIIASYRGFDGGDTADYLKYFQIIALTDGFFDALNSVQQYKFGYTFFSATFLTSRIFDFQTYLVIIGLISNTLLLLLYKKCTNENYLLVFIISSCTITHYYYNYNAIRQPISNILILLVILGGFKLNFNNYLKSLVSFDLHLSSIIYPPIYFFIHYFKNLYKYILLFYFIIIITISYLLDSLINIDNYSIFLNTANLTTFSFIAPLIIYSLIKILNIKDLDVNILKFYILIWITRLIFLRYNELFLRLSYCQHVLEPIFVFYIIKSIYYKFFNSISDKFFLPTIIISISITYYWLMVIPLYA